MTAEQAPGLPAAVIRASAGNVGPAERFLAGEIDREEFDRIGGWKVTDPGSAAWAARRLAEARETVIALERQRNAWAQDVAEWYRRSSEPVLHAVAFFEGRLAAYALEIRSASEEEGDPRRVIKSIPLPGGTIRTTGGRQSVVVDDPDALLTYAKANQAQAVKIEETVLVSKLSYQVSKVDGAVFGKLVDSSGEIIPGVHVEWSPTTAKVLTDG